MLIFRKIVEEDWKVIPTWYDQRPDWTMMPREAYPGNGLSGIIACKDDKPVAVGFVYLANSTIAFLDWIISDKEYREEDRDEIVKQLILELEGYAKDNGHNICYSIGRHEKLIEKHKELGWWVNDHHSYELIKII